MYKRNGVKVMTGAIYLVVNDFSKSLKFYEKLFNMNVSAINEDRFAIFNVSGLNLCLMNPYYDLLHPDKLKTIGGVYPEYDDLVSIAKMDNNRKVFINLAVSDLDMEYVRLKNILCDPDFTEIRFLEVFSPYWYFALKDPDGNPIEITGKRKN